MDSLRSYEQSFPPPARLLGEGYEAHVDDVAGRLIYSLPVDSSIVSVAFSYPITRSDLDVLLNDPWRRVVLGAVAHTLLQQSMIRGEPEVTGIAFTKMKNSVLHSASKELDGFITDVDRRYNIRIGRYAQQALQRGTVANNTHPTIP